VLSGRHSQPHPRGEDQERITRAREAAEALFTSKQSANSPSAREPAAKGRKPRVLQIISPTLADRNDEPEAPPAVSEPTAREIPRAEFARIRVWVKYGMTAAQVAQVYGVAVADIKRILRKI
jgi:hypothetical protein